MKDRQSDPQHVGDAEEVAKRGIECRQPDVQSDDAYAASDKIIEWAGRKERPMAAIVLDDESPNKKSSSGKCKQQRCPVGVLDRGEHDADDDDQRHECCDQLLYRKPRDRSAIFLAM